MTFICCSTIKICQAFNLCQWYLPQSCIYVKTMMVIKNPLEQQNQIPRAHYHKNLCSSILVLQFLNFVLCGHDASNQASTRFDGACGGENLSLVHGGACDLVVLEDSYMHVSVLFCTCYFGHISVCTISCVLHPCIQRQAFYLFKHWGASTVVILLQIQVKILLC